MAIPPMAKRYVIAHLRAACQTRGVTVEAVARRFGITASTVEDIEAGRTGWSAAEVRILCRLYGLDVTAVFHKPKLRLVAPLRSGTQLPT